MKRFIAILFLLTLALVSTVSALQVTDVIVNGVEITRDTTVSITRGEDVDIWVQLLENPGVEVKDVRIRAWVEGYEYGDIEDKTDLFDIHASTTTPNVVSKHLVLKLPDDLDATESYTLNVGIFFQSAESMRYTWDFSLLVSPDRHKLNVYDVIFNPSDKVVAGNNLYAKIIVENLGDKREENVKVTLSIPQLGVITSDYINDLSREDCTGSCDEEDDTDSAELFVKIPEDAKTGLYDAVVKIDYGRDNFKEEKRYDIFVEEKKEEAVAVETAPGTPTEKGGVVTSVISVDMTSQNIGQGKSAVYKIMFANLGDESETFSLAVSGVNFGTARVDPAFITVAPDKTGEAYVYVSANEDAQPGTHGFVVNVNADGKAVKDINLVASVGEKVEEKGISLVGVLEGIFIVLFVILLIVGIVLVVKKLRSDNEEVEEPTVESGSYY